ncbi:MAG: phosphoribosylglycinamide formyltransferase [Tepidisphaerales bacterium]
MSAGKRLRLAVLVSGTGRTLQTFLDLQRRGEPWEVVLVVASRPGIVALERAVAADVPTTILRRQDFDTTESFGRAVFRAAEVVRADVVLLAGWLSLLWVPPGWMGRVLNIHPALLPAFGGKGMYGHRVHEAVLRRGCVVSGCTVHFVDNDYDAGPIAGQAVCRVEETDTPETLASRVFERETVLYPAVVRAVAEGRLMLRDGRVCGRVCFLGDGVSQGDEGVAGRVPGGG